MRHLILLFVVLFSASSLFSQEVFKLGTVKGKHVTYEVREQKNFPLEWLVRNVHNPDTTIKTIPNPGVMLPQIADIQMQIAKILRGHLSSEELLEISKNEISSFFDIFLRVDRKKYKLLQVTCFRFLNFYVIGLRKSLEERQRYPTYYDGFWLNLDPRSAARDRERYCEKGGVAEKNARDAFNG